MGFIDQMGARETFYAALCNFFLYFKTSKLSGAILLIISAFSETGSGSLLTAIISARVIPFRGGIVFLNGPLKEGRRTV